MVLYLSCKLQKVEFDLSKHGKVITFFNRYFHLILFFITVMDYYPCIIKKEKNYIRMKIRSTAFLATAIAITLLTNRCSTKNSLLRGKIFMMLLSVPKPLKLLSKYYPPV